MTRYNRSIPSLEMTVIDSPVRRWLEDCIYNVRLTGYKRSEGSETQRWVEPFMTPNMTEVPDQENLERSILSYHHTLTGISEVVEAASSEAREELTEPLRDLTREPRIGTLRIS